ncbi:MAG: serine/threonine protein kinase [Muricoprocola sp.]
MDAGNLIDGRYRILRPLGKGSEGTVYLARQERMCRFYALKVLEKDNPCFLKEGVEAWKRLTHSGLPEIVDILEDEKQLILVMEYVEGETLESYLEKGKQLSFTRILEWGIQICEILEYLHQQNPPILYGDLKPSNIMLQNGRIVLLDLGSVSLLGSEGKRTGSLLLQKEEKSWRDFLWPDIMGIKVLLDYLLQCMEKKEKMSQNKKQDYVKKEIESAIHKVTDTEDLFRDATRILRKELKKIRNKNKKRILLLLICAGLLTGAGESLWRIQKQTQMLYEYDELLDAAKKGEPEEQREKLQELICLEPQREDGYVCFIQMCLEDLVLTQEEGGYLEEVLKKEDPKTGISMEEYLKKNEGGYAEVSYQMGLAYWYFYEGRDGRKIAVNWFQNVCDSSEKAFGEEEKRNRSQIYARIGAYQAELEQYAATGLGKEFFGRYWEDLLELWQFPVSSSDGAVTTLALWQEMLSAILRYTYEFLDSGVTKEEMMQIVDETERREKEILQDSKVLQENAEAIASLRQQIIESFERMERDY